MSDSIAREQVDRRVLLVEDEPRMRDMLTRATRDMEFEPTGVPTAEAGLAALEHDPFGIVVADLNLPGMQGMEMCSHIRRRWPQTQLIILTGFGDLDAARNAIRLDVADFLTKPCGLDELEAALDRALRRRRAGIVTLGPAAMPDIEPSEPLDPAEAEHHGTLRDVERRCILEALLRHGGNREATADELGISVRTLYYRLRTYQDEGFDVP